jgi:hypothetical protein
LAGRVGAQAKALSGFCRPHARHASMHGVLR